jgi:hypothetical protein
MQVMLTWLSTNVNGRLADALAPDATVKAYLPALLMSGKSNCSMLPSLSEYIICNPVACFSTPLPENNTVMSLKISDSSGKFDKTTDT